MKKRIAERMRVNRALHKIKEEERAERRLRNTAKLDRPPQRIGAILECPQCQKDFRKEKPRQKFCCSECRVAYHGVGSMREKLEEWRREKAKNPWVRGEKLPKGMGRCKLCRELFPKKSPAQQYCAYHSKKMRNPRYRREQELKTKLMMAEEIAQGETKAWSDFPDSDFASDLEWGVENAKKW